MFILSIDFIFNEVFEQRHRDRFDIVLGIKEDKRGIGYNTNQSQLAFKSGGFFGEGFLKGAQTFFKMVIDCFVKADLKNVLNYKLKLWRLGFLPVEEVEYSELF